MSQALAIFVPGPSSPKNTLGHHGISWDILGYPAMSPEGLVTSSVHLHGY